MYTLDHPLWDNWIWLAFCGNHKLNKSWGLSRFFCPAPDTHTHTLLACPVTLRATWKREGAAAGTEQCRLHSRRKTRGQRRNAVELGRFCDMRHKGIMENSAALAVKLWPHFSGHPGWHLGWTTGPQATDVPALFMNGISSLGWPWSPGASDSSARASLMLCCVSCVHFEGSI